MTTRFPFVLVATQFTLATALRNTPGPAGGSARVRSSLFTAAHPALKALQLCCCALVSRRSRGLSPARDRNRESAPGARIRACGEPHLELRPVAAGHAALARAAASLHGQVGAL